MRVLLPLSLIWMLGACVSSQETAENATFAHSVPSAVIEIRDGPTDQEREQPTQVVVLGTGTPIPDAHRAGPSIAVIHRGEAYLFDVGAGSIRNATVARYRYDIPSLYPSQICCVFLTHLHSDHYLDFSELAYTLWWRRRKGLEAWGPRGLTEIEKALYQLMGPDLAIRTSGTQPVPNPGGYRIAVNEIEPGIILERDGMTVEAFSVNHGDIKPAFGYRIETPDKTIVISGDTAYSETLLEKTRGADLLFHEVISGKGLARNSEFWQNYHRRSHTPAADLGRLAAEARPGKLVLYHGLYYGVPEAGIVDEVKATFDGEVVLANDLDVF